MKTLTVTFPEKTLQRIAEVANRLGLSVEALVQESVEEKLERAEPGFEEAAEHVLKKNAELYRRLA